MSTGSRLKEIRENLNLTQAQFGEILSVKWDKIREIEGDRQKLSVELASKLSEKYNINFEWLLTGKGEMHLTQTEIKSLEDLKEKYDLNDEELELVSELLNSPEMRKSLLNLVKDIKKSKK